MTVISREEIDGAVARVDVIAAMERAFAAYTSGRAVVPPVGELLLEEPPGEVHIKYGYVKGDPVFVIKVATGFSENARLQIPNNSGMMLAFSAITGSPVAILLDEGSLTSSRTAAAGAMVAKYLAPSTVERIGVLGTGHQAGMQVEQLRSVVPCRDVVVWGRSRTGSEALAEKLRHLGYRAETAAAPGEVAQTCNLIVTTTASEEPLLRAEDVRAGTHITAMGSDTPFKQELDPELLRKASLIVTDSRAQALHRGEVYRATLAGAITIEDAQELGDIVTGKVPGRRSDADITIADLTGVAVQDIEISKAVLAELGVALAG